jgi:hypothetical protein
MKIFASGYSLQNLSNIDTLPAMTRKRALTQLELIPAINRGDRDWVEARWQRADGTRGKALAQLRRKTEHDWYIARLQVDLPTGELLRDIPLARIEAASNADQRIRQWVAEGVKRKAGPRWKLKPSATRRRLDDQFYREVAAAYVDAVAHGLPPAKTLAEDSDTPQGTVNRWIAEARSPERGLLPKTTPGKARA